MTELWLLDDPQRLVRLVRPGVRCRCHAVVDEPLTGAGQRQHRRYVYCARCGRLLQIDDVELPCRD